MTEAALEDFRTAKISEKLRAMLEFLQKSVVKPKDLTAVDAAKLRQAGVSDQAILDECERGEDVALSRYRKALKHGELPATVREVVERQMAGVQANHDQIKALRDGLRART